MKNILMLTLIAVIVSCGPEPTVVDSPEKKGCGNQHGLGTPTDLVAVQKNDINTVQLTWTSHSTGDFDSSVEKNWTLIEKFGDPPEASYSFHQKINNEGLLYVSEFNSYMELSSFKEVKFRVKDCLKNDQNCCSDYTEFFPIMVGQEDVKPPSNISITEIPSQFGSSYRAIKVTWTDNSYGEEEQGLMLCFGSAPCSSGSIGHGVSANQTQDVFDELRPNTSLQIEIRTYSLRGYTEPALSNKFTTSP